MFSKSSEIEFDKQKKLSLTLQRSKENQETYIILL